jgi:hypothetical protein
MLRDGEESSRRLEQTEEHVVLVGSWPCKVSSEIHINGRRVSELGCEDKGKTMATEPKDEDPKRARVVLSKGLEVVEPGYSRLTGAAAKVMNRAKNSSNPSWVNWVSKTEQHNPSRVSWVSQNSSMDRRADRVNRVSQVGNTERKTGGSSRVANMESWVTKNSANTESRVTQNSVNMESQVTQNLANTESRVTENSANMENRVMQDSGGGGGRKPGRRKRCYSKQKASSTVVPKGYYQDTKIQIAKDTSKRVGREKKKRKSRTIGLTIYGQ